MNNFWIRKAQWWWNSIKSIIFFIIICILFIIPLSFFIWETWFLIPILWLGIFLIIWIISLYKELKIFKVKKYKGNWWWIVKQLTVTWIKTDIRKWEGYSTTYYYIEAKKLDDVYYSSEHSVWKIWGTSVQMLNEIYQKYWFEFDEKETHKQDVLRECDRRILEEKCELESEWMIRRVISEWWIMSMQGQRKIVEKWYEPEYWEVNWHRITVWDTVTVYIDPDNPKYYRVDIDFLFNK